jgi:hypothetical protein
VAPCDARGRLTGAQVSGTATIQDAAQTVITAELVQHRYGFMGKVMTWLDELRGHTGEHVGITITLN